MRQLFVLNKYSIFVIAFFCLLPGINLWAHICGPETMELAVGETKSYTIGADGIATVYEVSSGDGAVSTITPLFLEGIDGVFNVTGVAAGQTSHTIFWDAPDEDASGVCFISITVSGPTSSAPEICPDGVNMVAIGPGQGVDLQQVDFGFAQNSQTNSNWGRLDADAVTLTGVTGIEGGFLNVFTNFGWVVQNMALDFAEDLDPVTTYFTINDGEVELKIVELDLLVSYSNVPISESIVECPDNIFISFPVSPIAWDAEGASENLTTIISSPPPLEVAITATELITERHTQPNKANEQAAVNQCVPMSVANSLQYLENRFALNIPAEHKPGLKGDNTLVGEMDKRMGRTATSRTSGSGTWFTPMLKGKFSYLAENGLKDTLDQKHQGRGWGNPPDEALPDGDFTSEGITSTDKGSTVTWEWICQEIQSGEDVELIWSYDDASGNPTGGHAVRVFECGQTLGRKWLGYVHDGNQNDDTKGLECVRMNVSDLDGDGMLNAGSNDREIRFAFSESAKDCKVTECEITPNKINLNMGESVAITVKTFGSCKGSTKKLEMTGESVNTGLSIFKPAQLDVSPSVSNSPATFAISCNTNDNRTNSLQFDVAGTNVFCVLEVACNPDATPSETETETETATETETETETATETVTETETATETVTETLTPTPVFPPETPLTPTPTETPPTPTPTPTPTLTPTPTPTPEEKLCYIYFSIEEPNELPSGVSHGDIIVSNEWAVDISAGDKLVALNGSGVSLLPGGRNVDLLESFMASSSGKAPGFIGLDGFDIIELASAQPFEHKIIFTVEEEFTVTNSNHSLFQQKINEGDLLMTNGGVIRNEALIAPLNLATRLLKRPVLSIGIDALELEGLLDIFDSFAGLEIVDTAQLQSMIPDGEALRIVFSFEDINEEYTALQGGLLSDGGLVSADDLVEMIFAADSVSAKVIRSGADGIPASAPDILENCEETEKLGLDAATACLPEDIISGEFKNIYFSVSKDSPLGLFTHGDILRHNLDEKCSVFLKNSELINDAQKEPGLDGLDFFPELLSAPAEQPPTGKQFTFSCKKNLVIGRGGIERLILKSDENETCVLKLVNLEPGVNVDVSTKIRKGARASIKVDPVSSKTDADGQIEFTISAVKKGIDWIAWSVPNEKGEFEFTKDAFDSGRAWGMFVEVQ